MNEKTPKDMPEAPGLKAPEGSRPKRAKVRKNRKWAEVEVQDERRKGPFKYVKFVDEDGLETWWMVPE